MQVTYTHLDGTTITYTANTAVTKTTQLGNTAILTWGNISSAEATAWVAHCQSVATGTHTDNGVTYYTTTATAYVLDYGWTDWAKERLSPSDYTTFNTLHGDTWAARTAEQNNSDPVFMEWWTRYLEDSHVAYTE